MEGSIVMKVLGILFVVFGALWTIAGFVSYSSDIQIGIAISGINMLGIGVVMIALSNHREFLEDAQARYLRGDQNSHE